MKRILVTGAGGPAGRSVIALLLERNYGLVGTDMRPLDRKDYPFFEVPAARDPEFLPAIVRLAAENRIDTILPTVSEELPVFAEHWPTSGQPPAIVPSAHAVAIANDKLLTARALSAAQVPVPRYMLPSEATSVEAVAGRIGWPCISKPRVGRGGREVTVRWAGDFKAVAALGDGYILREFAPGTDYAPNVFRSHSGQTEVVVIEKTALKEGLVGNAAAVQRVAAADVGETASAAARAVGLEGPLDIDIRRRADGVPVVLEINARFGANIAAAPEILDALLQQIEAK